MSCKWRGYKNDCHFDDISLDYCKCEDCCPHYREEEEQQLKEDYDSAVADTQNYTK